MRKLIAFTGRKRSGKSTAEAMLLQRGFTRGSFIEPGKQMFRALLRHRGVAHAEITRMIDGDLKEIPSPHLNGKSPRYFMQALGLEFGRQLIDPDFWVHSLRDHMDYIDSYDEMDWVIADCRMPNEVDWLRQRGFFIIKIIRPGIESADKHGTEAYIDDLFSHFTVANDCETAKEFQDKIVKLLKEQGLISS